MSISSAPAPAAASVGDGGLGWLKKAYQRAKEQAKEENKSLEEVAAERWGVWYEHKLISYDSA